MQTLLRAAVAAAALALALPLFAAPALAQAPAGPTASADPDAEQNAANQKRLAEQRVTINFTDTATGDAFTFFQDLSGLNFAIDPALAANTVTLKVKDVRFGDALAAVADLNEVLVERWRGVIFVTDRKTPLPAPPAADLPEGARKLAAERRLTVNFPDVPLADVTQFVNDVSGLSINLARGLEDRTVSVRLKDVRLGAFLDVLCRLQKLKIERTGDVILMKPR